jgi:broad specificity phosphatase PhoE
VTTHGGVVRAVLRSILELPAERIFRISVAPASVTAVDWVDGEPIVRAVNRPV